MTCLCGSTDFVTVFKYEAPPSGEVRFAFSSDASYARELQRCRTCGHFMSVHCMDASRLYAGDYVTANYGDNGIRRVFDRINSLDETSSDNIGRVRRVLAYAGQKFASGRQSPFSLLDVGSGLGVFVYRMKAAGWNCTALDPDPRSVEHATTTIGVNGVCGDFMQLCDLPTFDVVTFNKVLEHVENPIAMLSKSKNQLSEGGFVYIEIPDGEAAICAGPAREEFFIDHFHIFSMASVAMLAMHSGFYAQTIERLYEPSGKYTIRAFLTTIV